MPQIQDNTGTFTRPTNTTAYASGDLVANSVTAGSVILPTIDLREFKKAGISTLGGFFLRRVRLYKTGTSITNAAFRVHFHKSAPVFSNGDNGAWLCSGGASYLGAMDVTFDRVFTDGAFGVGVPMIGSEINLTDENSIIHVSLEARAAYTPVSGEAFTAALEAHRY